MINWRTREGRNAISLIKREMNKGNNYRQVALMINMQKMLPEIITSEQVRGAKRYYIDNINRKKLDKTRE